MSQRPTLLIVDGHSMAFRAFFALPVENFTTRTGQHTNAVHGFVSMLTQRVDVIRMLPLEVVEGEEPLPNDEILPLYEFEPDAATVLDELLPLYVASRIHYCLLQGAASELASRQKAMKSATDNAQQLIERLTREANQARQAEITQEISEIVGGASALAEASAAAE